MRKSVFRLWLPSISKMSHALSITDWANGYEQITVSEDCVWLQASGLKDKNGVEIFEGDIVISDFGTKRPTEIKYGEFHDYTHGDDSTTNVGFYWNEISGETSPLGKSIHGNMNYCEVVGNIYENPELIKQ